MLLFNYAFFLLPLFIAVSWSMYVISLHIIRAAEALTAVTAALL